MAGSTPKTIILESRGNNMIREGLAGEAGIGPGDLLEHNTAYGTLLRHNTAGGAIKPVMVAIEKHWNDDDDDWAIDVDYANADVVRYVVPLPGDVLYMWLASGENASVLAYLESDGDGALEVEAAIDATDVVDAIKFIATEAVDASAAIKRIKVLCV